MNRPPSHQGGILQEVPTDARYLHFKMTNPKALADTLRRLRASVDGEQVVVGLGLAPVQALAAQVPGLRAFPTWELSVPLPATPIDLWCWLRATAPGADRGDLLRRSRALEQALLPAFALTHVVEAFRHADGRDLSGYVDGTENPAEPGPVALLEGFGPGLDGSSLVAVQQWRHDFPALDRMGATAKDMAIGRRLSDNEELDDAPASAHVKRTAQESFTPEAFIWRRSMPWSDGQEGGLMFVAFGKSLDPFEAQLKRMVGLEDGTVDALFRFSQPISGSYLWCPPMASGQWDLSALGL